MINIITKKKPDGFIWYDLKMPMKINAEWHKKNKMPKNPTFEQRLKWHREHLKNCSCHPGIPKKLSEEIEMRGIKF